MPELPRADAVVDEIVLPASKVTVLMRRKASGRDNYEATQSMLGDAFTMEREPEGRTRLVDHGWNPRKRYNRYLCYLAVSLITMWDALDDKGDPRPITVDALASMESERDYEVLLEAAAERVTIPVPEADKGAEDPFGPPSALSSSEENSPSLATSPSS